jgi:hypothetical protein
MTLVNQSTAFPGASPTNTNFSNAFISDDVVAFVGYNPAKQTSGLFTASPGKPVKINEIADTSFSIPDGKGNFTGFAGFAIGISGKNVAFQGSGNNGQVGVYKSLAGGKPMTIANQDFKIPPGNSQTFNAFGSVMLSGGTAVFRGGPAGFGNNSVYTDSTGKVTALVIPGKVAPDGGTFVAADNPVISGKNVAFRAITTKGPGIDALTLGGAPMVVADTTIAIPGG